MRSPDERARWARWYSASRTSLRLASASSAAWRRAATAPSSACASSRAARATVACSSASCSSSRRTRTVSRASSQRASRVWRSRRSCSSAASAWRLSGRRRERASRSTSSARSRLSCVRSSLSCARRRRLRCLPSPAASSISRRRSRGFDVTMCSTRPCDTTECISLPSPVSLRTSSTSTSRQRAPLSRYSPSPLRSSLRTIEISPIGRSIWPRRVVEDDLDLGRAARLDAAAAPEDDVLHRLAADGERRLLAHRPQHGVGDVRLARAVGPDDH